MFSKKRSAAAVVAPPAIEVHQQPRQRTVSSSTTTTSTTAPLVSPLQMNFDFDIPPVPTNSSFAGRPSPDNLRPQTSDGNGLRISGVSLAPPVLPPIPRVASRKEPEGSPTQEVAELDAGADAGRRKTKAKDDSDNISVSSRKSRKSMVMSSPIFDPPPDFLSFTAREAIASDASASKVKAKARDESDNVSVSSRKSRKSMVMSSPIFDPPPDFLSFSRPSSSSGPIVPKVPDSRPATSAGSTPRMESSLFPAPERKTESPVLPPINTGPAMSRAWIDARDKPYSHSQGRPTPPPAPPESTADIHPPAARSPSMNFSTRSPLSQPTSAHSANSRPSPQSIVSSPSLGQIQRPPTNYSGSTARSTHSSVSKSTTTDSFAAAPTIGTPYQETIASFPLPQHVATRPKTAGGTSTLAGVSVPTHHTSSTALKHEPPPTLVKVGTAKAEKRRTRLLNPMNLLVRRRSGQDEVAVSAEKAAQAQALRRQQTLATIGVSRLPEDFDPRIRGKVVHDFSAPRHSRRNLSYSENDAWNPRDSQFQSTSSTPMIPALQREGAPQQSMHSNKASDTSSRRSLHTAMFKEHFAEDATSTRVHAEKLENKDFLQRASQQSSVSQESAILPPFARRSQTLDPLQASYFRFSSGTGIMSEDEESKRSSDPSSLSGGKGPRDSGLSSISPVTARSSAMVATDLRASLSPVSPTASSPGKRVSGRPVSEFSRPASGHNDKPGNEARTASPKESPRGSPDELPVNARPFSSAFAQLPGVASIAEETPRLGQGEMPSLPARTPPEIPARNTSRQVDALAPPPTLGSPAGSIALSSRIPSPSLSIPSTQPTPEPQVAETVIVTATKAASPPKLVEKRASAVGHARRSSGAPKHRVSNASRFSFQFGGSAAEEQALEEKARKIGVTSREEVRSPEEEDEEEYFDEDAMDDMDEMELQQTDEPVGVDEKVLGGRTLSPKARQSVAQFMYRTPTLSPGEEKQRLSMRVEQRNAEGSDGGVTEDEGSDSDEAPYWMHEDFQDYDGDAELGQRPATASSGRKGSASELLTRSPKVGDKARSGFYMQPTAAGYSPTTEDAAPLGKPPSLPHRESGNSERNRVASGLSFSSVPPDAPKPSHRAAFSTSTVGSIDTSIGASRPFSQSTVGGSSSSTELRTTSTGLGLSGFSEFKFIDSAPPSRPTSFQVEKKGAQDRRHDSETLPGSVDWTGDAQNRNSSPLSQQMWNGRGSNGQYAVAHRVTSGERPVTRNFDDDDMYFDDGGFEPDIDDEQDFGEGMDEEAFDDPQYLKRSNGVTSARQESTLVQGPRPHRDLSPRIITSSGSDGPYPSFAMPNPIKARERDSRMLLEDLPLFGPPVDAKLIPQRNPSEDAKRLGLSNRVPPLPAATENIEAGQRVQASLQAYHAALAEAANKAAAEGRFSRIPSQSTTRSVSVHSSKLEGDDKSHSSQNDNGEVDEQPPLPNQEPSGIDRDALDSNMSRETADLVQTKRSTTYSLPKTSFDFGFENAPVDEGSIMDDDFGNDDDIVAAANAEALASDDDGFYGQEFGFYANARPNSGEMQAVNGGFFGLDGDDGLTRNKSLKEPNLTPITERSEFSTRNSLISLGTFGPPSAGLAGPGAGALPVLARLSTSPFGDHEITSFDQLRKLRAHAFGGSNVSLTHSDGKAQPLQALNESPTLSIRSAAAAQGYFGPLGGAPMSFGYSTDSSASSNPSSAHLQQAGLYGSQDSPRSAASSGYLPFSGDADVTPRKPQTAAESPKTARKIGGNKGHSRNSSGADSVTYVREQDPAGDGQPRWVLERRRTSEQGKLELIGREIVQGGWI